MKPSNIILFPLIILTLACAKAPEKDSRVDQLQKEVKKLSEQNKELESEVRQLQSQSNELERGLAAQTRPVDSAPKMTVERMKKEIKSPLDKAIQEIKTQAETRGKGSQYGMRVEYDLKKAFYGLIETGDERVPYQAKVIVAFEKFLESEKESKSYGKGTTMLMFSYRKNRWVLDSSK